MSEGGQLPWKVQTIDEHRGPGEHCFFFFSWFGLCGAFTGEHLIISPRFVKLLRKTACDYADIQKPLATPKGAKWVKDMDGHWSLVRDDSDDKSKRKYKLAVGEVWHVRGNRPAPTLVPIPLEKNKPVVGDDAPDEDVEKDGQDEHPTAVEGLHYLVHTITPSDTFSGLCLRYRIKPHELRRVNRFSGSNLRLAPHTLIIPLGPDGQGLNGGKVREQNRNCPEFKLHALQGEFPSLRHAECKAYLELADWDLAEAIKAAGEDEEWEKKEEEKAEKTPPIENMTEEKKVLDVAVPADIPTENEDEYGGLKEPLLRKIELPSRHGR